MQKIEHLKVLLEGNNVNDYSIDSNANKGGYPQIKGFFDEVFANEKKQLGWEVLSEYIDEVCDEFFPNDNSDGLAEDIDNGLLYAHDSTNWLIPYCYSFSFSRLLTETCDFGRLKTSPVKRLSTYVSVVADAVVQFAGQIAGAVGIGTFFIDAGKLIYGEFKDDYENHYQYISNCFQQFVHSVNHLTRGNESAFTNVSILSRKAIRKLISYETNIDELTDAIMYTQKVFLDFYLKGDRLRGGTPFSFPVVTINMVGIDIEILEILNGEYSRTNFYLAEDNDNTSTKFAMCCRYVLDAELMETLSGDANSFAATPFELGSTRVITVNLPRCALDAEGDVNKYYALVEERVNKALVILKAHRNMLEEFANKEILPLFTHQWMSMKRLFCTVGIIGTVEVEEILTGNKDVINNTIDLINKIIFKASAEMEMPINVEQVPGEQARFNLAKKDKLVHEHGYDFYSNQFVRLIDEVSFLHKIKIEGQYLNRLTGGGIAHLRMPGRLTLGQVTEVLTRCLDGGCNHLAISSVYSLCEGNHSTLGNFDVCPICGARIIDKFERIIGFFSPISRWNRNSIEKDFDKRKYLK